MATIKLFWEQVYLDDNSTNFGKSFCHFGHLEKVFVILSKFTLIQTGLGNFALILISQEFIIHIKTLKNVFFIKQINVFALKL